MNKPHLLAALVLAFVASSHADPVQDAPESGRIKVFILAGQSNMQGKGFPRPLLWKLGSPAGPGQSDLERKP